MSQVQVPPQKTYKYRSLRNFPFVLKTMKFKQSALMQDATADDDLLMALMKMFTHMNVPRSQWEYYLKDRGACSVFSVRWLSEVLGVRYAQSIAAANRVERPTTAESKAALSIAVTQCISRNVFLQMRQDEAFLGHLMSLHGLRNDHPLQLSDLSQMVHHCGSYFIGCDASGGLGHVAHAIAYTNLYGGVFFDPNAGEYTFTTNAQEGQKMEFLKEWVQINVKDGYSYTDFSCYQVHRGWKSTSFQSAKGGPRLASA
ncbi:MAG: hypothetical protein WCA20_24715 [Candidatus Sulfotelmatobacter sp.]